MDEVLIIIAAVVAVVAVLALAVWLRRTPTVGRGEMPATRGETSVNVAKTTTHRLELGGRTTVKSVVVRKITVTGQPSKESITIDGVKYGSVDEITDPKLRDQLRSVLHDVPGQIDDPKLREKVEREFADLGIEDEPLTDEPTSSGSGEPAGT